MNLRMQALPLRWMRALAGQRTRTGQGHCWNQCSIRALFSGSLHECTRTADHQAAVPTFRTIDEAGKGAAHDALPGFSKELALKVWERMMKTQVLDTLGYAAQRQGRFSFYLTCTGEEASTVASAAALLDMDEVFTQYREQGVLMWRGFTLREFADQLFGNRLESGKGRQMPIHYGSAALHFHTISSPLATQMPHAVGAAYALKMEGSPNISVCYFGEGAASEGDAQAAMNFAAVLGAPCLFICRNNGYAISTPVHEQFKGDGLCARAVANGMACMRVDGGDARAVFLACREARQLVAQSCQPVLVECMTVRGGHHSTSDDSSRYRSKADLVADTDPVRRLSIWMQRQGWLDAAADETLKTAVRKQVIQALAEAAAEPKPPLQCLFTDVYATMPAHLQEQMATTSSHVARNPQILPSGVPFE